MAAKEAARLFKLGVTHHPISETIICYAESDIRIWQAMACLRSEASAVEYQGYEAATVVSCLARYLTTLVRKIGRGWIARS